MDSKNTHYISLGTRCNSASIIRDRLLKRTKSYPFDWIDIDLQAILKFVSLPTDALEEYLTGYFKNIDLSTNRNKDDNTWFPHDFVEGTTVDQVTEKYIRRFKRFFELLESGHKIIFLTIIAYSVPDRNNVNVQTFEKIKKVLETRTNGRCVFVSVNLNNLKFDKGHHWNFPIKINQDWVGFDEDILASIRDNDYLQKYF